MLGEIAFNRIFQAAKTSILSGTEKEQTNMLAFFNKYYVFNTKGGYLSNYFDKIDQNFGTIADSLLKHLIINNFLYNANRGKIKRFNSRV